MWPKLSSIIFNAIPFYSTIDLMYYCIKKGINERMMFKLRAYPRCPFSFERRK
jgi:hypothetical protein